MNFDNFDDDSDDDDESNRLLVPRDVVLMGNGADGGKNIVTLETRC